MTGHLEDVVAVEVTIDGMLVIADQLHLSEFPVTMAILPNIPQSPPGSAGTRGDPFTPVSMTATVTPAPVANFCASAMRR